MTALAVTPDGEHLLVASACGGLKVFNKDGSADYGIGKASKATIIAMHPTSDSEYVFACHSNGLVQKIDVFGGDVITNLGQLSSEIFTPSFVVMENYVSKKIDAKDYCSALTKNEKEIFVASCGIVQAFCAESGKELRTCKDFDSSDHSFSVMVAS